MQQRGIARRGGVVARFIHRVENRVRIDLITDDRLFVILDRLEHLVGIDLVADHRLLVVRDR